MIEIKEGIDLDRAIAGVIGLICTQRVLGSDIEFYADPREGTVSDQRVGSPAVPRTFNPSTNLNNAFYAAEVTGLFLGCRHILGHGSLVNPDGPWWVNHTRDRDDELSDYSQVGSGATAALAICAAILKLEESKRP